MNPAELERELARLVRLAESARHKLAELGGAIEVLKQSIESQAREAPEPTTAREVAQQEVASK
jgi:hypothetical protein